MVADERRGRRNTRVMCQFNSRIWGQIPLVSLTYLFPWSVMSDISLIVNTDLLPFRVPRTTMVHRNVLPWYRVILAQWPIFQHSHWFSAVVGNRLTVTQSTIRILLWLRVRVRSQMRSAYFDFDFELLLPLFFGSFNLMVISSPSKCGNE